jgi:MFS transporter
MALVYAIVDAQSAGWGSARTLGFFTAAAMLLGAFVAIELRATAPLVRLSIFRVRSLLTANVAMFLAMSGMFAMFFFNTLYIQRVLGYGPLKAGLAFLPFTAGVMLSASIASQFAPRLGVRPIAVAGFLLSTSGLLLLTQLPVDGSYLVNVLPAILLSSLGMGAVFMPLTLIATTGLDDQDQGLASGLFNTSQQIGGALGLAVLSTLRHEQDDRRGRVARARARRRLPLGVRGRRSRHARRAHGDGRAAAQAPRRTHRGAGRLGGARRPRSLRATRSEEPVIGPAKAPVAADRGRRRANPRPGSSPRPRRRGRRAGRRAEG